MRTFQAVIEQINNEWAILEPDSGEPNFEIPIKLLPDSCHEGSIVSIQIKTDPEEEKTRRSKIRDIQDRLLDKSP